MANTNKKYGLIFPTKKAGHQIGQVTTKPSIFEEDSDSDTPVNKPTGISKGVRRQDLLNQEKAIGDDPTVYQYDEIYDDMDQKRKESKLSRQDLDKKPKYINRLLAAAEKRKRENERRIERQVQKEREEEGEAFKDKESFVTSAYKKKLEEMRELEEQEKREEYLESIGDVRKQGNLDGFYRHLYDQKVNYEDSKEEQKKTEVKEEPDSEAESEKRKSSESENEESNAKKRRVSSGAQSDSDKLKKEIKHRKYRARRHSEESDKSDKEDEIKKEHLPSNLDADSDFSIDSSDSDGEENSEKKENSSGREKVEKKEQEEQKPQVEAVKVEEAQEDKKEVTPVEEVKPKKPKRDIWKKVTVGEKYDDAVKRYFERKALREMQGITF